MYIIIGTGVPYEISVRILYVPSKLNFLDIDVQLSH